MITFNLDKINIESGYKVLDVGCGSGRHMAAVYDINDVTIIGSDICFDDLKLAKERMKFYDHLSKHHDISRWKVMLSDITCLPFNDNYFDLVICSEVLEHISNDKKAIQELVRVLKFGKFLVISVPRYFPEKICWMLSDEYVGKNIQKHVRIYRKNKLINLIESLGLSCYYSHYSHSFHTPFWILKCLLKCPKNNNLFLINMYHKFLVWNIMKRPNYLGIVEKILNPLLGKSLVLYSIKTI